MKQWLIIALSGFLSGCATFKSEPLNPASNGARLENRTLTETAVREFLEVNLNRRFSEWPPTAWDFEALAGAAIFYHPSLELARAQWRVALGGDRTAAGRLNPTISAVPGYNFSAANGAVPWIPSLSFDIPIETAGKRGYRRARAAQLSESARLNLVSVAWQVRAEVRTGLIDYIAARNREALLRQENVIHDQLILGLEQRVLAGSMARSELIPVRLARAKIQLELADARRQRADALVRLAGAMGVSVRSLDGLEFGYDLFAEPANVTQLLSPEARGGALKSRADILASLQEYAASQSALQLEVAKQYPDVHLGPGYQYDQGDHKFTFALTLELPLLNQNQGPIAEAEARRKESAARFNALQSKVIGELDHASTAYRIAQENLTALASIAANQQAQNEAVKAQVKAGAADPLDVLTSKLEQVLGELVKLDGQAKMHQAFGAVEAAIQSPIGGVSAAVMDQTRKESQP